MEVSVEVLRLPELLPYHVDELEEPWEHDPEQHWPTYQVVVHVGDWESPPLDGWVCCGYLPPGTELDIDGSMLAVKPKKWTWRCKPNDIDENGTPRVKVINDTVYVQSFDCTTKMPVPVKDDDPDRLACAIEDALDEAAEKIAASIKAPGIVDDNDNPVWI